MSLPTGFIYLRDLVPTIIEDVRYATSNNFIGRPINGYERQVIIITEVAGQQIKLIQEELRARDLCLKVFDAYRPQSACDDFWAWGQDFADTKMKEVYYPTFNNKQDLFNGFIAKFSNHSRGSTIDLTLHDLKTGQDLDMGSIFDFFGESSYTASPLINQTAKNNRTTLVGIMAKYGFRNYSKEWWHYELVNEPFTRKPEDHFNFKVQ
jgi:D-alanyl-D-alanine dipeptidase